MQFALSSHPQTTKNVKSSALYNIFSDDEVPEEEFQTKKNFPQSAKWLKPPQDIGTNKEMTTLENSPPTFSNEEMEAEIAWKGVNENSTVFELSKPLEENSQRPEAVGNANQRTKRQQQKLRCEGGLISLGAYKEKGCKQIKREPRYIGNLLRTAALRDMEMEIIEERQLKREMEDSGEQKEVFVTGAYKKRLEERKEYERKLMLQDLKDAVNEPTKKKDLTAFHQYMLSSGLAARSNKAQR